MLDTGIAERLRAAGLRVVEVDGWRTRGSSAFNPRGSVDHHTAGAPSGNAPSLGVCINGRGDLPGPLCNVLIARDNTCYVIAAGRANHAGAGSWKGLSGNSSVFGVERENVGTSAEPWRADQTAVAAKVHAALIRGLASPDAALVCGHKEWAPTRKTDAHTIAGADIRAAVVAELSTETPEDDMFTDPDRATLNAINERAAQLVAVAHRDIDTLKPLIEDVLEAVKSDPDSGAGVGDVTGADFVEALKDALVKGTAA